MTMVFKIKLGDQEKEVVQGNETTTTMTLVKDGEPGTAKP